ncbi:MAG: FKBP-type peptidyl-prolyl cis-trans isomerase [Cyclobacteriaceae bacterium]
MADTSDIIDDGSSIKYAIIDSTDVRNTKPLISDSIQVTYNVRLLGDTIALYSETRKKLALKNQITAWKITLPKIKQGYTFKMWVPSGYGYGNVITTLGGATVPANSNLQYEIILDSVYSAH